MHHNLEFMKLAGLASLLTALACGGGSAKSADLTEGSGALTSLAKKGVAGASAASTQEQADDDGEADDQGDDDQGDDDQGDDDQGDDDQDVCASDADCDADEVCDVTAGLCSDLDGEADDDANEHGDGATCNAEDGDGRDDDHGEDQGDDDQGDDDQGDDDQDACVVDTDCDADELCTNGLCTGVDDVCTSDADCDADEACTNGACEDR
jgi:hypothetical protein